MSVAVKPNHRASEIEGALKDAHIPSLMMALVHLTGDAAFLTDDMKPVYDFFGDGQGGLPAAQKTERNGLRDLRPRKVALGLDDKARTLPPPPDRVGDRTR